MNLLAFDSSGQVFSAGVQRAQQRWLARGEGGRNASIALVPQVLELLRQADLELAQLDAIVFGRGPGSFTGLRTACSVAQGLALGAGVPVLGLDTLLAVAEGARRDTCCKQVLALLDARMDQVYAAAWRWQAPDGWQQLGETVVCAPEALPIPEHAASNWILAGNAFAEYGDRLPAAVQAWPRCERLPEAAALLDLAPDWMRRHGTQAADQALPLYVRDKVAQTVAERMGQRGR